MTNHAYTPQAARGLTPQLMDTRIAGWINDENRGCRLVVGVAGVMRRHYVGSRSEGSRGLALSR
jgi:hypothetical protein